jgi:hypothetical protein
LQQSVSSSLLLFWQIVDQGGPRVSTRARRFVNGWVSLVLSAGDQAQAVEGAQARKLVELREAQLKGRLARPHGERAQETWPGAARRAGRC